MRWTVLVALLCACSGENPAEYSRYDWHPRWYDADKDCQDAREEVLIAEAVEVQLSDSGCEILGGIWVDPYTGITFTDPSKLDIDHMVPLRNAHDSGGHAWPQSLRRAYSNDLAHSETLIAVGASANRSKGARSPDQWLPPAEDFHCEYVRRWLAVKKQWALTLTAAEAKAIAELRCEW